MDDFSLIMYVLACFFVPDGFFYNALRVMVVFWAHLDPFGRPVLVDFTTTTSQYCPFGFTILGGGGDIICLLSADILQPYLQQGDGPIVLVVAPTRELAVQVL